MKQHLFVVEACEYKRHFLHLDVDYAVVTNIEHDHADYFPTMTDYTDAFRAFLRKAKCGVVALDTVVAAHQEVFGGTENVVSVQAEGFDFAALL